MSIAQNFVRIQLKMSKVRVRIAPSPTGYPHVGTAWQALFNWAFSRRFGGEFIIRIEDTDRKRLVAGAEDKLFEAIDWLGLTEDESPRKDGPYAPYRQSERLDLYKKYAQELVDKDKAYFCFCSEERLGKLRKTQLADKKIPKYDRHCLKLSKKEIEEKIKNGESYVIRLKVPANQKIIVDDLLRGKVIFDSNIIDDQVLVKSDGFPTYHLAVVVDDYLMKITHIIRGEEWLSSAPKHILLYRAFGWSIPIMVHTSVLRNPDKSKLSKRQGHTNISWYKENGFLKEALLNFLALLGWSHPQGKEVFGLEEFTRLIDLKDLSPIGPVFDLQKLEWLNGLYIRGKSDEEFLKLIKEYTKYSIDKANYQIILPLLKERVKKLSEVDQWLKFLFEKIDYNKDLLFKKGADKDLLKKQFTLILDKLSAINEWKIETIGENLRNIIVQNNWKPAQFFMALRVVISGSQVSLPLFESMEVLGKDESLERIRQVFNFLNE